MTLDEIEQALARLREELTKRETSDTYSGWGTGIAVPEDVKKHRVRMGIQIRKARQDFYAEMGILHQRSGMPYICNDDQIEGMSKVRVTIPKASGLAYYFQINPQKCMRIELGQSPVDDILKARIERVLNIKLITLEESRALDRQELEESEEVRRAILENKNPYKDYV